MRQTAPVFPPPNLLRGIVKPSENLKRVETLLPDPSALCLNCGLCCDGTLFGDVELQLADGADHLRDLGLPVTTRGKPRFPQPCRALGVDCRCGIYTERPQQCRAFECALRLSVQNGATGMGAAQGTIRRTRQQADRVRQLLRELGETDDRSALARRFQRLRRRFEAGELEMLADREAMLEAFAALTLAVHELQYSLRRKFYPDPSD